MLISETVIMETVIEVIHVPGHTTHRDKFPRQNQNMVPKMEHL